MEKFEIIPGGKILDQVVGYGALAVKGVLRVAAAVAMRYPREPFASHGDHFNHPLDMPVAPVTDWPSTERRAVLSYPFDSEGTPVEESYGT